MSFEKSKKFEYFNPVTIISGHDYIEFLSGLIGEEKTLLVTSEGFVRRGVVEHFSKTSGLKNLDIFSEVGSNPDLTSINRIGKRYFDNNVKFIIGIGGGSVIDTVKVLSLLLSGDSLIPLEKVFETGSDFYPESKINSIVIPTTSGTGAEVTPFATVWDFENGSKYSLNHKLMFPDYAVLVPELLTTLPAKLTLYTAMDTVSHAVESLWNVNSNEISASHALKSLEITVSVFSELMNNLTDPGLRSEMQMASLLSGLAISHTRTAIAHSISYPLTYKYNVPHGLACGFCLPGIYKVFREKLDFSEHEGMLIDKCMSLISDFDVKSEISGFLSLNEAVDLIPEMYNPSRAANFLLQVDSNQFKSILQYSF